MGAPAEDVGDVVQTLGGAFVRKSARSMARHVEGGGPSAGSLSRWPRLCGGSRMAPRKALDVCESKLKFLARTQTYNHFWAICSRSLDKVNCVLDTSS